MIPRWTIVAVSYGDDNGDDDGDRDVECNVNDEDENEEDTSHCITRHASRERLDIAVTLYHNRGIVYRGPVDESVLLRVFSFIYLVNDGGSHRSSPSLIVVHEEAIRANRYRRLLATRQTRTIVRFVRRVGVCICVCFNESLTLFSKSAARQSSEVIRGYGSPTTRNVKLAISRTSDHSGEFYPFSYILWEKSVNASLLLSSVESHLLFVSSLFVIVRSMDKRLRHFHLDEFHNAIRI